MPKTIAMLGLCAVLTAPIHAASIFFEDFNDVTSTSTLEDLSAWGWNGYTGTSTTLVEDSPSSNTHRAGYLNSTGGPNS